MPRLAANRLPAAWLLALLAASPALAREPAAVRTELARADVSTPGREAIVTRLEIAPGGGAPRHSHPGEEISYVLEGEGELLIDGEPARRVRAGDAFIVPAGKVHAAKNTGNGFLRVVVTHVVEKGKPVAIPAP